jgi:hypothetical protein
VASICAANPGMPLSDNIYYDAGLDTTIRVGRLRRGTTKSVESEWGSIATYSIGSIATQSGRVYSATSPLLHVAALWHITVLIKQECSSSLKQVDQSSQIIP